MKQKIDPFKNINDDYRYAVFSIDGSTTVISITGRALKKRGLKECEKSFSRLRSCIEDERRKLSNVGGGK